MLSEIQVNQHEYFEIVSTNRVRLSPVTILSLFIIIYAILFNICNMAMAYKAICCIPLSNCLSTQPLIVEHIDTILTPILTNKEIYYISATASSTYVL